MISLNRHESSQETQIAYIRLYLERAKQAFVEAGETYKPSKAEQKLMHSTQVYYSLTKSGFYRRLFWRL